MKTGIADSSSEKKKVTYTLTFSDDFNFQKEPIENGCSFYFGKLNARNDKKNNQNSYSKRKIFAEL